MLELYEDDIDERVVHKVLAKFEDAKAKTLHDLVEYYIENEEMLRKPKQAEKELGIPSTLLRTITASMVFQRTMHRRLFSKVFSPYVIAKSFQLLAKHATSSKTSPRDIIAIMRYAADLMGVESRQRIRHDVHHEGGVQVVFNVPVKPEDVFTTEPAEVVEVDALPVPSEDRVVQPVRELTGEGIKEPAKQAV